MRKIIYTTRDEILSYYDEEHQQDEDIQNEINFVINEIKSSILNKIDIKYKKSFKKNKEFKKIMKSNLYGLRSDNIKHYAFTRIKNIFNSHCLRWFFFGIFDHATLKNHISAVIYSTISSYTSLERTKIKLSEKKYFGLRKPIIFCTQKKMHISR